MGIQHVNSPDGERHEPKGISTAAADQVYVAAGEEGTGSWQYIDYELSFIVNDANAAFNSWIPIPYASKFIKAYAAVNSAFSADQTLTFKINNVAVTNGVIALAHTGAVAGTVFNCTPTALNNVGAGEAFEISNGGGSASAFTITLTLIFERIG
jgi:fumarate reductase subunit C